MPGAVHVLRCRELKLPAPTSFRILAATRLQEAKALLSQAQWSGPYYLAGYAVECALKACVTRDFSKHQLPDWQLVRDTYTHSLERLVDLAKLRSQLKIQMGADSSFALNWTIVKDWKETSRYMTWTQNEAEDLYKAITQRNHGVLRWTKQYW